MKLLNQSIKYVSISILFIITIWSVVFYINMVHEIKSSIDEGLENYKRLIIHNAHQDPSLLNKEYFDESFFTIREIDKETALTMVDQYIDTELYMQDNDDPEPELEPVRMLITAFEFNDQYYELKVANSMVEKEDMIRAFFVNTIWLYIVLIIGIVLINNVILKKLWSPFYNLLDQLERYRLGRTKNFPEIETRTKEFTDLQKTVNILLTDSKTTFEKQKQFIGNASHELQTPLAIAINKLELLLEEKGLEEEQAQEVTEIYQIIQRMVRLNKSLLLLSKIENKQFIDNQRVNINEVVLHSLNELEDFAHYKGVRISIKEMGVLNVEINPPLAQIIVSNLLRNAIFHNIKGGTITVYIANESLIISNTGSNTPLDPEKIFSHFYKSNTNSTGTGLGLPIVKAITDLYNFPISYSFIDGRHSIEILFPSN